MPDAFSTENQSIHRKKPVGLQDQFDLHKLLYIFLMKVRPAPCG